jgi:6-pyruvoyltetrahydropterin/6-carboxytetrahydropterin synthase
MKSKYVSTKTYGPEEGFAVCYRQWRADRKSGKDKSEVYSRTEIPGCCALHGYALGFHIEFECDTLDARNWCVDFGSLRTFKEFLKENFDHTMLVAEDDPYFNVLENLHKLALAKMVVVEATGCEALSKFLYDYLNEIWLPDNYPSGGVRCRRVEVRETPANMAMYGVF